MGDDDRNDEVTTTLGPRQPPTVGDGAVVRIRVAEGWWAESVPPVPDGYRVTVSLPDGTGRDEHAEALGRLGYLVVDAAPAASADPDCADFFVPQQLLEAHPTYWRSLADRADRAYSLALGPVRRLLGEVLAAHAAALAADGG